MNYEDRPEWSFTTLRDANHFATVLFQLYTIANTVSRRSRVNWIVRIVGFKVELSVKELKAFYQGFVYGMLYGKKCGIKGRGRIVV